MLSFDVLDFISSLPFFAGTAWAQWIAHFLRVPIGGPFPINAFDLGGIFEMFAVLVILIHRYARSRRDEERLESELEAARVVQKILIPDEVPSIPGFQVHTFYKPASQVGGDFFQIIPLESGGALIAVGDVSGKGMPAAMTVSLLVGTLRTLAHYTQSPSEILAAMNQRMLARSAGGFTTCLVVRVEAIRLDAARADGGGKLVAANAGHLPPYLDRKELTMDSGLPLGVAAGSVYCDTSFELPPRAQLTLMTDGVVEARSKSGELFGFDRAAAISTQAADEIARAALNFGQEDDITVLTVGLAAAT